MRLLLPILLASVACGDSPGAPDGTSLDPRSGVHVWIEPQHGEYPIDIVGPVSRMIVADSTQSFFGQAQPLTGYAFAGDLLPGRYVARLGPLAEGQFVVIDDSATFVLEHSDTASITFRVAPARGGFRSVIRSEGQPTSGRTSHTDTASR
jgi:hypothetical protein